MSEKKSRPAASRKTQKLFVTSFFSLFIVSVLVFLIFSLVTSLITRRYVESSVRNSMRQVSLAVADIFAPDVRALNTLAAFAEENQDRFDLQLMIDTLSPTLRESSAFYYATALARKDGGFIRLDIDWKPDAAFEPNEQDWFVEAVRAGGSTCYLEPYLDAATGALCMTISRAVKGSRNNVLGVTGLDLRADSLIPLLASLRPSSGGRLFMITANGTYITNPDAQKVLSANYFEESRIRFRPGEALVAQSRFVLRGGRYYYCERVGESPWYLVADGKSSDFTVLQSIIKALFLLLTALLCLLFGSVIALKARRINVRQNWLAQKLSEEVQKLMAADKAVAAAVQEQSAAVKKAVSAAENAGASAQNMLRQLREIAEAERTACGEVSRYEAAVKKQLSRIATVSQANAGLVSCMKALGKQLDGALDARRLLDELAAQAKIIALNAELEASAAGADRMNFRLVANEIRRLSDELIGLSEKISGTIAALQELSDGLLLESEVVTRKITETGASAQELDRHFWSIRCDLEIAAGTADDVVEGLVQQAAAMEQRTLAAQELAAGADGFAEKTAAGSGLVQEIGSLSAELIGRSAL